MAQEFIYRKNPNFGQPGEPEMLAAETIDLPEHPAIVQAWDAFDFKNRFTPQERIAIRTAAKSDASVEDFMDMLDTAGMTGTRIKADDALLNVALAALESAGLIGAGRKDEILGA